MAGSHDFDTALAGAGLFPLSATGIRVLQINVGKLCNQQCTHCHVDAGPDRREQMTRETAAACVELLRHSAIPTVDITGGAPELNPNFRWLVEQTRALGRHVMDRSNLTVLLLPAQADLIEFLARNEVEVVASLPCYLEANHDRQRGAGTFARSIEALKRLNRAGYGLPESKLKLHLVYNPTGLFLPPSQTALEQDYRRELGQRYGIRFHSLYTLVNMPINRFRQQLVQIGGYDKYMTTLVQAFNPAAAAGVMCRYMLSIGWDGTIYDCDFNQMLELPVDHGLHENIRDLAPGEIEGAYTTRRIVTGPHCYGCAAGAGSTCTGESVVAQALAFEPAQETAQAKACAT